MFFERLAKYFDRYYIVFNINKIRFVWSFYNIVFPTANPKNTQLAPRAAACEQESIKDPHPGGAPCVTQAPICIEFGSK
jgi:hypothetical protein